MASKACRIYQRLYSLFRDQMADDISERFCCSSMNLGESKLNEMLFWKIIRSWNSYLRWVLDVGNNRSDTKIYVCQTLFSYIFLFYSMHQCLLWPAVWCMWCCIAFHWLVSVSKLGKQFTGHFGPFWSFKMFTEPLSPSKSKLIECCLKRWISLYLINSPGFSKRNSLESRANLHTPWANFRTVYPCSKLKFTYTAGQPNNK